MKKDDLLQIFSEIINIHLRNRNSDALYRPQGNAGGKWRYCGVNVSEGDFSEKIIATFIKIW